MLPSSLAPAMIHSALLRIAGMSCVLHADSSLLPNALARWISEGNRSREKTLSLTVHVEGNDALLEPAHFRGMGHLVVAEYGSQTFLFDMHRRAIHAWISEPVAGDADIWSHRFVPLILGVMGCTVGLLPLHSACVVRKGRGFLIAGESMAGKSTLSVALAKQGFSLLSDDWTYIHREEPGIVAHGLNVPVKLLPDAAVHFPELNSFEAVRTANGEIAYEVPPNAALGVPVADSCRPSTLLFLERVSDGRHPELNPASPAYVLQYVENSVERLPHELEDVIRERESLIHAVSELPAWIFRYSGSPQVGAEFLARFVEGRQEVLK